MYARQMGAGRTCSRSAAEMPNVEHMDLCRSISTFKVTSSNWEKQTHGIEIGAFGGGQSQKTTIFF